MKNNIVKSVLSLFKLDKRKSLLFIITTGLLIFFLILYIMINMIIFYNENNVNVNLPEYWNSQFIDSFIKSNRQIYFINDIEEAIQIKLEDYISSRTIKMFENGNIVRRMSFIKSNYLLKVRYLRIDKKLDWIFLVFENDVNPHGKRILGDYHHKEYNNEIGIRFLPIKYMRLSEWRDAFCYYPKEDDWVEFKIIKQEKLIIDDNELTESIKIKISGLGKLHNRPLYEWWSPYSGLVAFTMPDGKMYIRSKKLEEEEK